MFEIKTKEQIAVFLPQAIEMALSSYENFYKSGQMFENAKEFTAHHSACKAAIVHIEQLIKLARWADDGVEVSDEDNLLELIKNAEAELNKIQK